LSAASTSIKSLRGSIPAPAGFHGTVTVMRCSPEPVGRASQLVKANSQAQAAAEMAGLILPLSLLQSI
jgi:hypothetical protein